MTDERTIEDMKMLIIKLARKHPNEKLAGSAIEYLHRKGLITPLDVLRTIEDHPND